MPILFDKVSLRQHRDRAAANYNNFSFLKDEAAIRLIDRLELVRRDFDLCLDFGSHDGVLSRHLSGLEKIGAVIHADLSPKFATTALAQGASIACDIDRVPFRPNSFDAVFSCLTMHWVDDLPGSWHRCVQR